MKNAQTTRKQTCLPWIIVALFLGLVAIGCSSSPPPPKAIEIPNDVKSETAIKVQIEQSGVYKLTIAELQANGLQVDGLSYNNLSLTNAGQQVPYHIDGDSLIFYGSQSTSRYSLVNPYILRSGAGGAQMMMQPAPNVTSPLITSVPQEVRVEQNLRYEQRAAEYGGEVWFWQKIVHSGEDATFELDLELPAVSAESAELIAHWWGLSYTDQVENDHDIKLIVNNNDIDIVEFNDQTYHTSASAINGSLLVEGTNKIVIDNSEPGAWRVDQVYLDWVALRYFAPTVAINGRLSISERAGLVQAEGFTEMPLAIDITNPAQPAVLAGVRYENSTAEIGINEGMQVELIAADGYLKPASFSPFIKTDLRNTSNQSDLLIVTTRELAPSLAPLVTERKAQGLGVTVALVDELYDEFGHGATTPDAINEFVRYASQNWAEPKPSYLFLVGDATIDTLGYSANNPEQPIAQPRNIVPSPIVEVSFSGETVADARLADIDGDLTPDLAVGRWPVDTQEEVASLVKRTLAYEKGVSAENAVFTFDASSTEFSQFTDQLLEKAGFPKSQADLYSGPTSAEVLDTWDDGAWIVSYVGHGGLKLWGKDEILTKDAAAKISSDQTPPIVLQFSCLTGHFAEFTTESISETMLKNEDGPVLLVASTGLTLSTHQSPFAIELLSELQNPETYRMGDAFQSAKDVLLVNENPGLQEISDTFGLIGDPSAIIVRPGARAVEAQ